MTELQPINKIIIDTVLEYYEHPYFINDGYCEDFASDVQDKMRALGFRIDVYDIPWNCQWPNHTFFGFQGKFYDAEEPMGVSEWWKLPIYLRLKFKGRRPNPNKWI